MEKTEAIDLIRYYLNVGADLTDQENINNKDYVPAKQTRLYEAIEMAIEELKKER